MSNITVYTTPSCPWCHKVKAYLNEKGVAFQEVDVSTDDQAAQNMVKLTGQRSVPVVSDGSQYVVGFDPDRLEGMVH